MTVKVRFADFRTITRSSTLSAPTDVTRILWDTAADLLTAGLAAGSLAIRLLGAGVSGLEEARSRQRSLFDADEEERAIDTAVDGTACVSAAPP